MAVFFWEGDKMGAIFFPKNEGKGLLFFKLNKLSSTWTFLGDLILGADPCAPIFFSGIEFNLGTWGFLHPFAPKKVKKGGSALPYKTKVALSQKNTDIYHCTISYFFIKKITKKIQTYRRLVKVVTKFEVCQRGR